MLAMPGVAVVNDPIVEIYPHLAEVAAGWLSPVQGLSMQRCRRVVGQGAMRVDAIEWSRIVKPMFLAGCCPPPARQSRLIRLSPGMTDLRFIREVQAASVRCCERRMPGPVSDVGL